MSLFTSISEVWKYLDAIPKFQSSGASAANFGLKTITELSTRMGGLHAQFPAIHVAGTNGKGTVCHLLDRIYREAGVKTGLFTSPHLLKYNERVKVSGEEVSDEMILKFFIEAESLLLELKPTYFEISTLLSFWVFAQEEIELAIIETGLGGRLDSTNIVEPILTIITSISLDHQGILGDTIQEIALEKAGIIKTSVPLILGDLPLEAEKVINKEAYAKGCKSISVNSIKPLYNNGLIELSNPEISIQTRLIEPVNRWNVGVVSLAVKELKEQFQVSDTQWINAVESFEGVPARFEKLTVDKDWYFTGAHNEEALLATMETLKGYKSKPKVAIITMMKDKVTPKTLSHFQNFDKVYFYPLEGERAATYEDISDSLEVNYLETGNISKVLKELETSLVIFAGSFYFYPTVKQWMELKN